MLCRLPRLSTFSIQLKGHHQQYDLNPAHVLGQVQLHAAGLRCLSLQLDTSLVGSDLTWACLGKMVSLTKLQLTFDDKVRKWIRLTLHTASDRAGLATPTPSSYPPMSAAS
jgi:hypothetical protein